MTRQILAARAEPVLQRVMAARPLVAFDFDGTLAPLADDPAAVRLRPPTRRLLGALAARVPVAVISGRRRAEVAAKLRGLGIAAIVGNHGIEYSPSARPSPRVTAWRALLAARLPREAGVWVEDKRFSLAIHYRHAPSRRRARLAITRAVADLPGAATFGGKAVVNVVPGGAPDKAAALERLCRRFKRRAAIYVGDDLTDERVFAWARVRRSALRSVLTVRVGRSAHSRAAYFLSSQRDIDVLLWRLLEAYRLTSGAHRRAGPRS